MAQTQLKRKKLKKKATKQTKTEKKHESKILR